METRGRDIVLPPEFSGPAQLKLFTSYGDPRTPGWDGKWISTWHPQMLLPWFPVQSVKIHKHFWPLLEDALLELEQRGLHKEIRTANNCFQTVHLLNSSVLSVHSWGAAIDINAADNPTGSLGEWSPEFIDVMVSHGIYCGQNWTGNKEPMHFSMVDGQ